MNERGGNMFVRRSIASLLAAVAIFVCGYAFYFVAPAPGRFLYNISANPGGILFMGAALFVVYGLPIWAVLLLILSFVGPLRSSGVQAGPPSDTRDSEAAA